VESYDHWLAATDEIPKLLTFDGPPDVLLIGPETVDWCARNIASLEIENCGDAGHLAPEDQSESIAAAITEWANRQYLFSRRHR
jgi:haloalkane dehalogenase